MCGILFTTNNNISEISFRNSLELLNHRGPDATGYLKYKNNLFGHKRLKILDIDDRSNQPFYSKDERYIIIFNGEIYNYLELAKRFNIKMITNCDTELIVELFALIGSKCVTLLEGMFSFLIYDTLVNDFFIARDHLGVKPLYISEMNGTVIISSEISPILNLTNTFSIDPIGIRQYIKLRTFFNNRTIYKEISFFPAGYFYENSKLIKYWDLPVDNNINEPSDSDLRNMVIESINKRLISDVPVGSFLSGGIDSSIIASLSKKPDTWTIGFEDNNEFSYAQIVANKIGSNHHEVIIDKKEFIDLAKHMIHIRKEPLSVPNEVLIYKMSNEAKKSNTVILCGEGADELFYGYDRIYAWAYRNKNFNIKEFSDYYSYSKNNDIEIVEDAIQPYLHLNNSLKIVSHFFQMSHLHGLLRRVDNATMLASIEARVPFVDNIFLVETLIGQSYEYKNLNGIIKSPLKRIFSDILPLEIINRKKVGFPVPLDIIFESNENHMDKWFDFNLKTLFGNDFNLNDIKI